MARQIVHLESDILRDVGQFCVKCGYSIIFGKYVGYDPEEWVDSEADWHDPGPGRMNCCHPYAFMRLIHEEE
jgi:hypothetical protein